MGVDLRLRAGDAVSDAIYSAEYARELLQRAIDGSTVIAWDDECGCGGVRGDEVFDAHHWRDWYRETFAAVATLGALRGACSDDGLYAAYTDCYVRSRMLQARFAESINALGMWWGT